MDDIKNSHQSQDDSGVLAVSTTYEGPLPHPSILAQYDTVQPGTAKLILDEFKKNSEHVRQVELIKAKGEVANIKRGQYMAFVIAIGLAVIIIVALYLDLPWIAGLVAALAGIATIANNIMKK